MTEEKNIYNFIIQSLKECFYEVGIEEFKDKKFVAFGTNLTSEFDRFMSKVVDDHEKRELIIQEKMISHIRNKWEGFFFLNIWNEEYSKKMLEDIRLETVFKQADYLVFFSAHHWNLRDMNIIEIGIEYEKKYGGKLFCYDFTEEKLYGYRPITQYYKGMKLYQDINSYLEMVGIN